MSPHDRWLDGIARNLIRYAAHRAPAALSERLGEEWLADLSVRSGALSQLRFALGCCWATAVIAHEFGAPVRAAAAATVNRTSVGEHSSSGPSFSRRTTVILLIVGFHLLVVCVLASRIAAPKVLPGGAPRIDVSFLPRPEHPIPPKLIAPTFTHFRVDVPTPRAPEFPAETLTTPEHLTEGPPVQPTGAALPVHRLLGGPGAGFPNTDDFYPETSRRLGEQGIATVSVCVDGTGRLIGKPTLDQSSGSGTLDEGALRLAQAGSGHYRATTEDGRPVTACYAFRVRFELRR